MNLNSCYLLSSFNLKKEKEKEKKKTKSQLTHIFFFFSLREDLEAKSAMNQKLLKEVEKYQSMFEAARDIFEKKSKEEYEKVEQLTTEFQEVVQQLEQAEHLLEKKEGEIKQQTLRIETLEKEKKDQEESYSQLSTDFEGQTNELTELQTRLSHLEQILQGSYTVLFPSIPLVDFLFLFLLCCNIGAQESAEKTSEMKNAAEQM